MQLDEAKTMLLLYFARAFTVNQIISCQLNKALVLSLIPSDYKLLTMDLFSHSSKSKVHEKFTKIISQFNAIFFPYLDENKECLYSEETNLTRTLLDIGHNTLHSLSKTEYLILFAIYLSLHRVIFRVNYIVDIADME